jgi:hypothetical protein
MQTLRELPSSSQHSDSERMCLPERCSIYRKLEDEGHDTRQIADQRRSTRYGTARQGASVRQARSTPNLRDSFLHTVRRLRRGKSLEEDSVSPCTCKATTAAQSSPPDVGVHKKALRVVSGIIDLRRQPETSCQETPPVPQPCGRASKANSNDDVAQSNGGVGVLSSPGFAHRHNAAAHATPDRQNKRPSTYIAESEYATENEVDEQIQMNDSMMLQLEATMVDLKSDLEWLDPGTTLHRDFSIRNRASDGSSCGHVYDAPTSAQELLEGYGHAAIQDLQIDQDMEGLQTIDSLPELDQGYQSSDSGLSIADELIAKHLMPAQSMRDLLPKDIDGQFGGFYGVSDDTKKVGVNALPDGMDWTQGNSKAQISRFSMDSSVYSDAGGDMLEEERVWWRPKPLNIFKELGPAPPIPERNPLRLMKRLSNSLPKSFGNNARGSRNIHGLHLDLSGTSKGDKRNSWRTSVSSRRRSQMPKHKSKTDGERTQPSLALPGHILDAMRSSTQTTEASVTSRNKKRSRRSTRTSDTLTKHPSSRESTSQPSHAKQLKEARGHIRATSEPFQDHGVNRSVSCKWNETMPSHGCIRRSCIAGLANEVRPGRSVPSLAINKQLPPLPVMSES